MKRWKKRLLPVLATTVFFVFTVIFYGPLSLYLNNSQELFFELSDLLKIILPVSALCFLIIAGLLMALPKKVFTPVLVVFFGIALSFYLQGNILNISYGSGVMDGKEIDWSAYRSYAAVNTGIWILVCVLPLIAWIILKKKEKTQILRTVVTYLAIFLTLIQVPAMIVELVNTAPKESKSLTITDEGLFELSDGRNTLIYILDTYDEVYYEQFLKDNPSFPDTTDGVVHYGNTLTSAATTMVALPSMLTGQPFRRDVTYSAYLEDVWGNTNPISAMSEKGIDVRIFSESLYFDDCTADYVANFELGNQKVSSYAVLGKKLYKLTLSKFFPHLLKRFVWFYTGEFDEAKEESGLYKVNDAAFYETFLEKGFSFSDKYSETVQIYHLHGAHSPYNLGADGKTKKNTTLNEQLTGSMRIVEDMLEALKASGHYDDTRVMITADHGDKHKSEQPLFLLKDFGTRGEYASCDAPLSLFDLPVLFYDDIGVDFGDTQPYGMHWDDMLAATQRERRFFRNASGSSKVKIDEYRTTGHAGDYDSLELVQSWEDPFGADTPYELGEELSFTTDATGNRYTVDGFSTNTGFRTRIHGPYASLEIPVDDAGSVDKLIFDWHFYPSKIKVSEVIIKINGNEYFHGEITRDNAESIVFTVDAEKAFVQDNKLKIELEFPEIPMEEMEKSVNSRTEAISLIALTISGE